MLSTKETEVQRRTHAGVEELHSSGHLEFVLASWLPPAGITGLSVIVFTFHTKGGFLLFVRLLSYFHNGSLHTNSELKGMN